MAKGSHSTWADWEPRSCEICGERITLTGKNARGMGSRYDVATGIGHAWHADCKHPRPAPRLLEPEESR